MIRIAIVEDDTVIRDLIRDFLRGQDEFESVSCFGSVEDFLRSEEAPFQVVLLDIELPGMSGLEGAFKIKQETPDTDILMLTVYDDKDRIFRALQGGASGYLLKSTSLPKLKTAILEMLQGGAPMSPVIAKKVITYFSGLPVSPDKTNLQQLTAREKEVSLLLIEGNTYKQVAYHLHISTDTVRQHIKNIYRKLQINSRVQLIREFRN
ncbi:MAG TPA: response regulator transcription factor [Puia sp.]|nr:response regulator transcription factor [Puia sp.]